MATGDITIDGIKITPEGFARLAAAVTDYIEEKSNDPGQFEEVGSLQGVTSLPVFQQYGDDYKLVRVLVEILKGEKGDAFTYEDFTPEQLEALSLKFENLTEEQLAAFYSAIPDEVLAMFQEPATVAAEEVYQALIDLNALEEIVAAAEKLRIDAELDRDAEEQKRKEAEDTRIVNNALWEAAETERKAAETLRQEAEEYREETTMQILADAETATEKATTAAERANELSDNRDYIKDGYWWRYNEETKQHDKTDQRADGNTLFATFGVDPFTGLLKMFTKKAYDGPEFFIENGYLKLRM